MRKERKSCEKRYCVSLLDAKDVSPERFLTLASGHWQVENCLHLVKDQWWDEDRHWTSRPGLAAVFVSLTNAVIFSAAIVARSRKNLASKSTENPMDHKKRYRNTRTKQTLQSLYVQL